MRLFQTRFGTLALGGIIFLIISLSTRLILTITAGALAELTIGKVVLIFTVGLFYDVITFCYFAAPAALALFLLPNRWTPSWWSRGPAAAVYFITIFLLLFNACAEWLFWDEFGTRFNFVAVDYLVYTTEVIKNIRESYPFTTILVSIGVLTAGIFAATWRPFVRAFSCPTSRKARLVPLLAITLVATGALIFIDDDDFQISKNYYANELSHNGIYSLVDAFEDNVLDYDQYYLKRDPAAVFSRLRPLVLDHNARFIVPGLDIRRHITAEGAERRLNVVLIVVESLSAEFLGVYRNQAHLTPNLDALAAQSLFFDNLYATGTRTDRGLEATTLSIPPTPGRAVIKRPNNANMFTLMNQFQRRGYDTKFLYGGFGYFDNMNNYFAGNGAEIVDRAVLTGDEITFANAWGVCDEDLYRRTIKECDRSFGNGRPFFSLLMTTSNHRPFTYPQTIDIPSGTSREGAVKYTDYAIGQFLKAAKSKPWFDSTIFVIVADHCAGSAGEAEINYAKYHIPLFIYAPRWIKPQRVDTLASQIDLAPTLLGQLNFSYDSLFFGRDLMQSSPDRVMVGNYQKLGYSDGKHLMVLLPRKKTITYLIEDGKNRHEIGTDQKLLEEAIAYYQAAHYLLSRNLYHR
ncbi:MAG: sulfatase [Desulfobacterales bacterium CG07_land_8_20_14_0_80_52_14]|nr:MAG: sulfatase [Desulfobacterales bacterium CG07_land_8_20_14_0_80_52_14]